ncbi:MAG: carbohydrate deacetylase [Candidatus Methylomirabilis sp.]
MAKPAVTRGLIINADDFNLTAGVSRGIAEAHRAGIVSSTTVMVNLPGLRDNLGYIQNLPRLGLGLHLNLTFGPPVSPAEKVGSLLGPDDRFVRDPDRQLQAADPEEIAREWTAQVEAFVTAVGRPPTHLDTHHNLHARPPASEIAIDLARRLSIALRPVTPAVRAAMAAAGLPVPAHLIGDIAEGPYWTVARLLRSLDERAAGVTELCCHPGRFDEALMVSRYNRQREAELEALIDPAVKQRLRERRIALLTYADLVC